MATITINIPVDKEEWVLDGLALSYNYIENIENPLFDSELPEDPIENPFLIPNPQSKAAFVKEHIIEKLKYDATHGHISTHWATEIANAEASNLT